MIGTADLITAIVAAWNASGLNDEFHVFGGAEVVLYDAEAEPGQSYPYCVMEPLGTAPVVTTRMSGRRETRGTPLTFVVVAKELENDSRTGKELAATLAEEVMKVFGGHPEVPPSATITLSHGNHLITQYQNDYGMRTMDDGVYEWYVLYNFVTDVPVA